MYEIIIISGNVGKSDGLKYTPDGKAVLGFSVGCSRNVKDEWKTVWYQVSLWNEAAEHQAERIVKGKKVLVQGKLNADYTTGGPRLYQRKDGTYGASYEILADVVRVVPESKITDEPAEIPY